MGSIRKRVAERVRRKNPDLKGGKLANRVRRQTDGAIQRTDARRTGKPKPSQETIKNVQNQLHPTPKAKKAAKQATPSASPRPLSKTKKNKQGTGPMGTGKQGKHDMRKK